MGETTQLVALTTRFHDMLRKISQIVEKGRKSKTTCRILSSTLKSLTPLVQEIKQYNEHLNPPRDEIKSLMIEKDAEEREEVACKCSFDNFRWDKCFSWLQFRRDRLRHQNGDDSFAADDDDKEDLTVKDVKETLYKVREILELLNKENFEQKLNEAGAPIFKRPFGVPENPEFTVGLDIPLSKLKMELLRDDGMSTFVLTGIGGSGKTTLATKLCWDEQVKGKFKENIIFVTFSKTPKLKIIVERIFDHCGFPVPEFQSDDNAISTLGRLLGKIEGSPMLLVLDDVWPGSEDLVEKFQFQISDYKIMVTSRVAYPRFSTTCILKPLADEDAIALFCHYAHLEKNSSNIPEDLVQKVVGNCKGLPLAIKVIATSLSNRRHGMWQKIEKELSQGRSILDANTELLARLHKFLDVLEENPIIKECFMDLALFPEDQRIAAASLIDMWAELYGLDDDGIEAMDIINNLVSMNLANVLIARKDASDTDNNYYNNHFIFLHDLLRELGIYQSTKEPIEQRKRLIIDTNENKSEWWNAEKQQGMMMRILSKYLRWCLKQDPQQVPARTLSISIDETNCASDWSQMQPAKAEVLILNLRTKRFYFPQSMEKMSKLKALIIINYGFHHFELSNSELVDSLSNLKRIRLERISVPSFGTLKNLKKLSLYMCNTRLAFEKGSILISDAFPNLVDLSIDYCKDVVGLPTGVCDITPLKKLSITNCHKLSAVPKEIGNLENLELLRLSSCTDLEGIPESVGRLSNLRLLDISNCISLPNLPEEIGNLCNLRTLYMTSCARCELPYSVATLENLKVIICDEETASSWEAFQPMLPNLKIEVPHLDVNLNWLH